MAKSLENAVQDLLTERAVNLIVGLLGVVAIFVGVLPIKWPLDEVPTVLVSVGTSLIASAIVAYLTSIYMFKRRKQKEISEVWGLESIIDSRAQMNGKVNERLKEVSDTLDIIAYGLKSLRESRNGIIRDRLSHGVNVRIVTVNPSASLLSQRDIDENKQPGSTAESIKQLCMWANKLNQGESGSVRIWFIETLPTEVYFRVDEYIYVGPYQIGRESQQSITMEYRDNGKKNGMGFKYYQEYFDKIIEDAKEVNLKEYVKTLEKNS